MDRLRDIRSCTLDELGQVVEGAGQPAYRAGQISGWLHERWAAGWEEMGNLPKLLRERLASEFALHLPQLVRLQGAAGDSTRKFLWRLRDGMLIESVLIPANPALYGESSDRHTLCVSTQVGCAYGCRFCASGLDGWKRNLTADEIVGQVAAVERWHRTQPAAPESPTASETAEVGMAGAASGPRRSGAGKVARLINNLVIMGMGEPLANYEALLRALTILNAPWGGGIGARKITVSTSGLVPEIRRLAQEPFQFGLAISLHGATDAVRSQIMPVNRKYPLAQLVAACEDYAKAKGRMVTLEYILIAEVNDGQEHAAPLATLARRLHAKVNLIPYNPVEGLPWHRPSEARQEAFLAALTRSEVKATLRREKGADIDAACGQLRLRVERGDSRLGSVGPS